MSQKNIIVLKCEDMQNPLGDRIQFSPTRILAEPFPYFGRLLIEGYGYPAFGNSKPITWQVNTILQIY